VVASTTTVKTPAGTVKVGTVAAGRPRVTKNNASKAPTGAAKAQNSQAETCRSVPPRDYCENYEQVRVVDL
jgi:hypothetical protein